MNKAKKYELTEKRAGCLISICQALSRYEIKYPTRGELPVYALGDMRTTDAGVVLARLPLLPGETTLSMLYRIHGGGPIYSDCVTLAYIVDSMVLRTTDELILAKCPPTNYLPRNSVALDIHATPKPIQHVALEFNGQYLHCCPRDPCIVVSSSLDEVCEVMAGALYPYTIHRFNAEGIVITEERKI